MNNRKRMGKDKDGVIFPVAPKLSEMSDSYLNFIEEIKKEIQNQRISVVLNANSSMICLYWNIGKAILQKQEEEGWGAKVIDRMAKDLKDAFPDMSGFSPRNIKYMRFNMDNTRTNPNYYSNSMASPNGGNDPTKAGRNFAGVFFKPKYKEKVKFKEK